MIRISKVLLSTSMLTLVGCGPSQEENAVGLMKYEFMGFLKRYSTYRNSGMAEREGFEPSIRCRIHTFQACAFDHSATSPWARSLAQRHRSDSAIPS